MSDIESSCPRCGAKNTSGAWMCWRCNSTLVATSVLAPVSMLTAAPTAQAAALSPISSTPPADPAALVAAEYDLSLLSTPRRQARTRQPILWALAIVSAGLLIVAPMVMKGILPQSSSELPDSIHGFTRVDNDPSVNRAKDQLGKAARRGGVSVTAAAYRRSGKALVVEVYSGISAELTASNLLETLAGNLQHEGTTVAIAQETRTYGQNGVTQACAPMTGGLAGAVCYWTNLKRVGLIMGIGVDRGETGSISEAVRQVVGG